MDRVVLSGGVSLSLVVTVSCWGLKITRRNLTKSEHTNKLDESQHYWLWLLFIATLTVKTRLNSRGSRATVLGGVNSGSNPSWAKPRTGKLIFTALPLDVCKKQRKEQAGSLLIEPLEKALNKILSFLNTRQVAGSL